MIKLTKSIFVLLIISLLPCCQSIKKVGDNQESIKIIFEVKSKIKKLKENQESEIQNESSVFLGDAVIEQSDDGEIKQLDFIKKKIFQFDSKGNQPSDNSIYADVVFRNMELSNRAHLLKMVQAGNLKVDGLENITLLEHLFSMKLKNNKGEKSEIRKITKDGVVSYFVVDKEIFSYSNKELIKISKHEVELFTKFLRHHYGVHPDILEDLTKKRFLPRQIKIKHYEIHQTREINLILKSFDRDVINYKTATSKDHLIPKDVKNDALLTLIQKTNSLTREEVEKRRRQILDRAVNYAKNKNYLPSAISFFAYPASIGGGTMPKEFNDYKYELSNDRDVKKLLSTIGNKDFVKNPDEAITILDSLVKKGGDDSYLLLAFKANYLNAKNRSQAVKLFQEALSKNEIMPNIWIDLGKNLMYEYRSYEAWKCYYVAKKLTPNHPMLSEIYKMEKDIELKYPEFF